MTKKELIGKFESKVRTCKEMYIKYFEEDEFLAGVGADGMKVVYDTAWGLKSMDVINEKDIEKVLNIIETNCEEILAVTGQIIAYWE